MSLIHAQVNEVDTTPVTPNQPPVYYHWNGCAFESLTPEFISVPPITNPHPRIVVTPSELTSIQADIAAKKEPRYSAWMRLQSGAKAVLQEGVVSPCTGEDTLQFIRQARQASRQLELLSMAYLVGGEKQYAAKAQLILTRWAEANPPPGSVTTVRFRFPNAGMDVARGIAGFIYAYDALYHDLSDDARTQVENWFRSLLPVMYTGIKRWDSTWKNWPEARTTYRWKLSDDPADKPYFGGQYYQNHLTAHAMGILLVGYAVGDRGLVQFAVDCKENPRDMIELINGMILMKDKPPAVEGDRSQPHQDGEIVDRYRHVQGKGLGYAMLSFDEMLVITETLYRNGLDLYAYKGKYGENMELPFTFYADFWRTQDASLKGGYYQGEKVGGTADPGRYEIGNRRYPGNSAIEEYLLSVNRADGQDTGLLCCPTLISGQALKKGT